MSKWIKILLLLLITLLLTAVAYEILLHLYPHLLPGWYRNRFPLKGIELYTPGILAKTPIEGVPLPLYNARTSFSGTPPSYLQELGMVKSEDNPDPINYPRVKIKLDAMGFANPKEIDSPDVVLIGDSFVFIAGILYPPGLQKNLSEATNLKIYNMGVPSIGPVREGWLMENTAIAKNPKVIIWFFFGGNDIGNATDIRNHQRNGITHYGQLFPQVEYPQIYLFDMWAKSREQDPPEFTERKSHGWILTKKAIRSANKAIKNAGIELIMVYIPTKAQVYLPYVEKDAALIHQMASIDQDIPFPLKPDPFYRRALRNRNYLERLLQQFCRSEQITFISATPYLEELASAGKMGYLCADTHWNDVGQNALMTPLMNVLQSSR